MILENTSGINECLEEIGARIKDQRIASHLTQRELSLKAGISVSSVCRIEQGKSIQFDNLLCIMKALNLLSKLEIAIPAHQITPMQRLSGEQKKKTYRKSGKKIQGSWEWGE